ncbi:hypothetical protein LTR28_006523 [Elasticomyces elasticus]|nr:hypothetical protein LTR28_006523 [Elasticomyces elasticus]
MSVRRSGNGDDNDTPVYNGFWDTRPQQARYWLPILYSASQLFLRFVVGHEIKDCIKSLVVYTDEALETAPGAYPHYQLEVDHCWQGSAAFWHDLLSVVNPSRLTILASPVELACLVNCSISTVHEWAFSDMDFHILSLHQNTTSRSLSQLQPYNPHHAIPRSYSCVASASILHARPWHHAALNEGSFLKAYATYEYFERGPPSVIYSIKTFLHGLSHDQPNTSPILSPHHSIDSFAYTAIFPFANHITATRDDDATTGLNLQTCPKLKHLTLQLAPDPHSTILDDPARVGKADLSDCWAELESCYASLGAPKPGSRNQFLPGGSLQVLVCKDYRTQALCEDLDRNLGRLGEVGWEKVGVGTWRRTGGGV